eukprot:757944-Hanusia_phi.AAC.1
MQSSQYQTTRGLPLRRSVGDDQVGARTVLLHLDRDRRRYVRVGTEHVAENALPVLREVQPLLLRLLRHSQPVSCQSAENLRRASG